MVGIDIHGGPGSALAAQAVDRPCPKWLQGIARWKRLSSVGAPSGEPAAVSDAMAQLCAQNVAERLSAARLLAGIARHGDADVLDVLLGNTISSAGFGASSPNSSSLSLSASTRVAEAPQFSCGSRGGGSASDSALGPWQACGTSRAMYAQRRLQQRGS
jgi:hypothetical protein